jgi:hypothetical protein
MGSLRLAAEFESRWGRRGGRWGIHVGEAEDKK